MKVPSIEEAHKIVSDTDLGVGCVVDEKELNLACFVFNHSPIYQANLFRVHLQEILDAAADEKSSIDLSVAVVDEESLHNKMDVILASVKSIDTGVRNLIESFLTMHLSLLCFIVFACICFGILLIKVN